MTRQIQPGHNEFWSLPGGIVDAGESILHASKRELLEETGYASQDWYFFYSSQMSSKIDWANFYLVAKNCQVIAEKRPDPGEKIRLELLDVEHFTSLVKEEDFRNNDFALWFLKTGETEIKDLF
jgi:ADP-ribose pyrophosphatase